MELLVAQNTKIEQVVGRFMACRQPDCSDPVRTRGWCNRHYLQFRAGIIDVSGALLRNPKFRPGRGWRTYCRGYRKIMAKGHPYADSDGYVLEHRLVMEKHLGRYLEPHEVVHHLDGVKDNNVIENLQLRTGRKTHGYGHEQIETVEQAMQALERLLNIGMSGREEVKARLEKLIVFRLTLAI